MLVEGLFNYTGDFSNQVSINPLELEHALIMLLLLMGLLSIHGKYRRYVPWVIVGGVAISLFTPTHSIELAWPVLSALILPPFLWKVSINLASVRPVYNWRSLLAWLLMVILIGLALSFGGKMLLAGALLIGVLAASLMWQLRERDTGSSDLGAFGQLTLALLLVEVDVALHPLGPFLGSLFSGAALGLVLGFVGVRLVPRFPAGKARNLFYLGLIYLAYLVGIMMGTSGVTMAIMTGLIVASYSFSMGLWPTKDVWPAPLNRDWVFLLMAWSWLLLGWQAHVHLTTVHVTGIGLVLVAAAFGVLAGRWLVPMPESLAQPLPQALIRMQGKVFLLLLGVILMWSQEAVLTLVPLAVALLAALVVTLILRSVVYQVFYMAGIKLRWPE